ncbi:hypothetical protein [Actibacterium sp. 188UL27-1]|uniref:hypothetical protein n=1 Tax=Actibacterium sp. 188UL27-1 TaxID=2786961 RepID=UPI00195B2EA0|nr:hypothetical protein [Actibacterium sp. 188UL27-1]MBM7066582.1 hypothetical protein [Actibacterium sp. 188UL27-1]
MLQAIFENDLLSWIVVALVVLATLIMVIRPFLRPNSKNGFIQLLASGFLPKKKSHRGGGTSGSYSSNIGDFGRGGDGSGGGDGGC